MLLTRQNYMSVEAAAAKYIKRCSQNALRQNLPLPSHVLTRRTCVYFQARLKLGIHEFFTKRNAYILSILNNGEAHSTHFFSTMEYRNIFSFTACDYSHHVYFFHYFCTFVTGCVCNYINSARFLQYIWKVLVRCFLTLKGILYVKSHYITHIYIYLHTVTHVYTAY